MIVIRFLTLVVADEKARQLVVRNTTNFAMVIDGDELRPRPSQIKDELKDSQIDELELSKTNDEFKPSQEMTTAKFVELRTSS